MSYSVFATFRRWIAPLAIAPLVFGAIGTFLYWKSIGGTTPDRPPLRTSFKPVSVPTAFTDASTDDPVIRLSGDRQAAIGLAVETVDFGPAVDLVKATGQVVPDESKFAYITPRAAGVVRSVAAHVGKDVKAGDLLAMIDSPQVSECRFDLYTRLQELEIDRTQAGWQETIFNNTLGLLERCKAGDSPEDIHRQFENRPVGANREQLLRAYASYRLGRASMERNRELIAKGVITPKQFQQVSADYESAQATYQGLIDQMDFTSRMANTRAQNALRRAETAVRVAREHLRVLGVRPDGTEPEIKDGHVVGVRRDGILPPGEGFDDPASSQAPKILPETPQPVSPAGASPIAENRPGTKDLAVSAYALWAPFDGTVLDRELIVPGVYVDTTHRIFTLADLSTVWIEVNIPESHYGSLSRGRDAELSIASTAYPGRVFKVEVIYTGDLVDPQSRSIKLLARADNQERMLKPGMFVDVTIRLKGGSRAILIPEAALLIDDEERVVYVQTGPEQFERRRVELGASDGHRVAILKGLSSGDRVVIAGGFKLKSKAIQLSSALPD